MSKHRKHKYDTFIYLMKKCFIKKNHSWKDQRVGKICTRMVEAIK